MENFDSMTLPESLMHTLKSMQFTKPTPIQAESIPHALAGKDVLGSAQTGTGKTAAFGIPLVSWLHSNNDGTSLILTPTRELAVQVRATLNQLLGKSGEIKTALLIGGESMGKQLGQLQGRPRVIVGTPGRINDHIERKSLKLHNVGFFVLDEIDRMLDIGLGLQVDRIVKFLPRERQTLMFSATLPEDIIGLSQKYLINPVRVAVGSTTKPIANIKQETIQVQESEKYDKLISELDQRQGSIIIFVKTKYGAEKLAIKLCKENHSADAMHGDLRQNKRDKVIQAFRNQKYRIMVATDIAARGLDIPHIEHVINYDLPQCPEDYIHRIGRTARAGAEGFAVNLIAPGDGAKWRAIHNLLNPGDKLPYMAAGKTASRSGARPQRGPSRSYNSGNKPAGSSYGEERRNNGGNSDRRGGSESRSYGDASGFNTERRRSGPRPDSRFGAPSGSGRGGNTRFGNGGSESGAGFDGERRRSGPSEGGAGGFGGERRRSSRSDKGAGGYNGGGERRRSESSEGGAGGFGGERRRSSPSDKGAGGYNGGGERRRSGSSEGGAGGFGGERRRSASSGDTRFGAPASRRGAPSRSGGRPGGNSSAPRGGAGRSTGGAPRQGFSGPGRTGGSGQVA